MILNIDLVSDFVCPWCFLGKVRLDRALAELKASRPDLDVRVNWLPFFLNPDTPAAGEPYRAFLEAKFGGPIKAEAVLDKVRDVAADDGLVYAFERIQTRPNTLAAHRLMYRTQANGQKPERIQALAHGAADHLVVFDDHHGGCHVPTLRSDGPVAVSPSWVRAEAVASAASTGAL